MKKVIKCPHCGAEYLAEEIFYPSSVFNKDLNIIKDEKGKILNDLKDVKTFDLEEEFECEYCNKSFKVSGDINFSTVLLDNKIDFEDEF